MQLRILLALLTLTGSCFAGVAFTVQMSRAQGTSTYRTWTEGRSLKAVVEASNDSDLSKGNFVISRDGGATWIAASARWKRYLELSPEELQERLGSRGKPPKGQLESLTLQRLPELDGGKIAGYSTRRHTVRITVTLRSRSFWRDVTRRMVVTETLWIAEGIPTPAPELGVILQESTGVVEIDRALTLTDVKGFPMKRLLEIDVDGERVTTTTVEVKTLAQTQVADSVFAVPANYKKR
ncbi:MAG: hypothetical protein L0Z53_05635 [Acidobacteriales bacterium]|nr:hypothetical protein [Terriglobales bacterium]